LLRRVTSADQYRFDFVEGALFLLNF